MSTPTPTPTHTAVQQREAAERFAKEHAREIAAEIIEWQGTSILRDGRLREMARLCEFAGHDAMKVAEYIATGVVLRLFASLPAPQATLPNVQATAPERIYLVIGEGVEPDTDFAELDRLGGVTWCADKIDDNSIPYVRADLASLPAPQGEQPPPWTDAMVLAVLRSDSDGSFGADEVEDVRKLLHAADRVRADK